MNIIHPLYHEIVPAPLFHLPSSNGLGQKSEDH